MTFGVAQETVVVAQRDSTGALPMQSQSTFRQILRTGGYYYTFLYALRRVFHGIVEGLDRRLVRIEQRRVLVEPWAISARRHTGQENKLQWNVHDWSSRGEEWTRDAAWKQRVVSEFLVPYVPVGATVVEIGPGGGRWTELLQSRADRLIVVDVAERALELCRERFAHCENVKYLLGNGNTVDLPDSSVDVVWSFDVFVHVNPLDAKGYFGEFQRILKPGGHGMVHHAGEPPLVGGRRPGWRSDLTSQMVLGFLRENGLRLVRQFESDLVNPDDALTVFEKPDAPGV